VLTSESSIAVDPSAQEAGSTARSDPKMFAPAETKSTPATNAATMAAAVMIFLASIEWNGRHLKKDVRRARMGERCPWYGSAGIGNIHPERRL
jgi:hypothetical protein